MDRLRAGVGRTHSHRVFDSHVVSAREKRLAENEAFFREINERLEEQTPDSATSLVVICECANEDCAARISLPHADYETVRAEPTDFIVTPGHADPEIEEVVWSGETFDVVRKRGLAGDVAESLDASDEAKDA